MLSTSLWRVGDLRDLVQQHRQDQGELAQRGALCSNRLAVLDLAPVFFCPPALLDANKAIEGELARGGWAGSACPSESRAVVGIAEIGDICVKICRQRSERGPTKHSSNLAVALLSCLHSFVRLFCLIM